MAVVADATRGNEPVEQIPLIEGTRMRCPRCKRLKNILEFVPMGQAEEFKEETNPVYKCPDCRWIFSPTEQVILEAML